LFDAFLDRGLDALQQVHAELDVVEPVDADLRVEAPDDAREQILLDELVVSLAEVGDPHVRLPFVLRVLRVVHGLELGPQSVAEVLAALARRQRLVRQLVANDADLPEGPLKGLGV